MKNKKFISLLLVVLLLVSGCGSQVEKKEGRVGEIQDRGKLIVATSADYPPYEYIQNKDGKDEIVGFDIEIVKYIAKAWDVELEVKNVEFEALLMGLESGMYDMVIAGMSPDPDRKASFSNIYYNAEHGLIVRKEDLANYKSVEDMEEKKIGVQLGSVQEDILDGMEGVDKQALGLITNLIMELKTDKIDGILMEKPVAESFAQVHSELAVVPEISIVDEAGGSAIAMREDDKELAQEVNVVLKDIEDKGLVDEWIVKANEEAGQEQSDAYGSFYLAGIKFTLLLSFFSLVLGFLLGLLITKMRMSDIRFLNILARAFVELIRGTPLMVQILLVYYGTDTFGIKLGAFTASLIAVAINSGAYVSEIIRSGIESVDKGQMEAGRSLGLSKKQTMNKIIMPQAFRNILPALGNEFVTLIKETSIASTIGVAELMYQTKKVQTLSFEGIKPLLFGTLIYFVLTFSISLVMKKLERKLAHND